MYLSKVTIENIKGCARFCWHVEAGKEAGWHVIIGDNGAGKTTILEAIALALIGEKDAQALRQDWGQWLRHGQNSGMIELKIAGPDQQARHQTLKIQRPIDNGPTNLITTFHDQGQQVLAYRDATTQRANSPNDSRGFCASFGAFRRLDGGETGLGNISSKHPLYPHLSLFDPSIALLDTLEWLKQLRFKQLEGKQPEDQLLSRLIAFINSGNLLPGNVKLQDVRSEGVFFSENGNQLEVLQLSDGYRSVIGLVFELIRQLAEKYEHDPNMFFHARDPQITTAGLVLIDEVDAHLHPSWQQAIGPWLVKYFPNMQFIVSTHSPLVCQAAERGSIWRISPPGEGREPYQVLGNELNRLLYGDLLDAMSTDFFGRNVSFSEQSLLLREKLANLNQKALFEDLSPGERDEQQRLRGIFSSQQNIQP